jgi:multidrug efflux pump subunit AcrA (membrane-fusion protein)
VRVPLDALVHGAVDDAVFVLDFKADPRVVRRRHVETARADGDAIVLRAGLAIGERVVAEGATFLRDGDRVDVLE